MRRFYPLLSLALLIECLLLLVASANGAAPAQTTSSRPITIKHIRVKLRVDLPKKTLDAQATLQVRSLRPVRSVRLDAVGFKVHKVVVDDANQPGRPVPFHQNGRQLAIELDPGWPAGHDAALHIDYRVTQPKGGLYFFGPMPSDPDVPLTVWSQGEAIANRYWIPCLDQPDQKQTSELIVTAAEGNEVLSNGRLVERSTNSVEHTVTFHWLQGKPHSSYLITLVVGPFEVVREQWHGKPVLFYVPKGHHDEIAPTFGRTLDMLTFFSKRFGIEYPWDKYAQVIVEQFTMGGMENTSATTLTDRVLHDRRSLLDNSPDWVIAHEMTHQWWGDLVTCRDWTDLWLNEGFATYGEVLWAEHSQGPDEMAYLLWQKSGPAMGGAKGPVVPRGYTNPDALFDNRVYPKGGWVLHMLRRRLGEDAFWKGMKMYGERYRYRAADTSDYRRVMEEASGQNLQRFFYDWTERGGYPILQVTTTSAPGQKTAKVTIEQTQAGEPFHFPLRLSFTSAGDQKVDQVIPVTQKWMTCTVPLPGALQMVEVDPGQTLLVEIHETKSRDLWVAQLHHAASVPARIRAVEHFAGSKKSGDCKALCQALAAEPFCGVKDEIAQALAKSKTPACRDALIAQLTDKNAKVRRACARALGEFGHDKVAAAALATLLRHGDESYFVLESSMNACARLDPKEALPLARPWLNEASYHDVLRRTALDALGHSQDSTVFDSILAWTRRGKPRDVRTVAIHSLAELASNTKLTGEQVRRTVDLLIASLEGENWSIVSTAQEALKDLASKVDKARTRLKERSEHAKNLHLRHTLEQLVGALPAQPAPKEDVKALHSEVERLRRENQSLREQLKKLKKAA